jgi:hypothetical protein
MPSSLPLGVTDPRVLAAFAIRLQTAIRQAQVPLPSHATNGDEDKYGDKSGTYSKALKQSRAGVVAPAAFAAFRSALGSPDGSLIGTGDFESVPIGGTRKLNGPLGSFAYTLVGTDSQQFGVHDWAGALICPPAPRLAGETYAGELIELYWASLLRDVPFSAYPGNATAQAAAAELNTLASYKGPRDTAGKVTPDNLFRGGGLFSNEGGPPAPWFAGETIGPYVSQFLVQPTTLGVQPIDQFWGIAAAGQDYMKTLAEWEAVQSGVFDGTLPPTSKRAYAYCGRSLSTFTHQDELYQAYFVAYLVLRSLQVPPNPDNPYATFTHQQPFGTFGPPDIAATLAAVARVALNAVWYQKWIVHLRHRPESGGGIVELEATGHGGSIDAKVSPTALNSKAIAQSASVNGSHLLAQAFPEGSPAHPAYPTGHGTVGGACITVLKFFFDGGANLFAAGGKPRTSAADGQSLEIYSGPDAASLTVDGELHKLAHNITFGHGIHGGIHWRSDSDFSIRLGEAVALSYLQDQVRTYKEKVSVRLTRVDGSVATIYN